MPCHHRGAVRSASRSGRPGALVGVLVAVCLWGAPHVARAQEPTPLLEWQAPEVCPSRAVVEAEIERILGRRPAGGPYAGVTVTARVGRVSALLLLEGGGRRRIEAASCEALLRAVALILALHIDPDALSLDAPEPPPEPAPPPPEPPVPELEGPVDLQRARHPDPARELGSPFAPGVSRDPREPDARFLGGAALSLDLGAMPDTSPGIWLGASARLGGLLEVGLEARYQPEQRASLAPRPQVGAEVTLVAGRLRLGAAVVVARLPVVLELVPVAAIELGSVSARAVGLMTPLAGASLWWALDVGLEARAFFLDALGLFLRGELQVALRRSSFLVEGYETPVFRAADVGFVGLVGALLRTS